MNKEMIDEELTLKGLKRNLYEYRFQRSNYVHEMWLKSIEDMEQENKQLKDTIDNVLEMVCCIEHNLDKYEEVGLDHFEYAQKKICELKEYLIEILKGEK